MSGDGEKEAMRPWKTRRQPECSGKNSPSRNREPEKLGIQFASTDATTTDLHPALID
jgi:hypothetical protein